MIRRITFFTAAAGCTAVSAALITGMITGLANLPVPLFLAVTLAAVVLSLSAFVLSLRKRPYVPDDTADFTAGSVLMTSICVLAILAQIICIYLFRFENTKVIENVKTATWVFETGRLTSADPMMLLLGAVSRITRMHPLKLIYTILPAVCVPFYYICYYELIATVCKGRQRFTAFVFLILINLWGYRSVTMIPAALLLSWFSLPVFVIHGLIPVASSIMIRLFAARPAPDREIPVADEKEELSEEWDMKKHRIINARNLAIGLGILAALLAVTVVILNSKINRLYDATVNLQKDMNGRCSIHEFIPQSGRTEGYLIKGENGELTFIGGGSSENAEELGRFLLSYGSSVDKWYVYGDTEEDAGAMREVTSEKMIDAGSIYVINREEIKEQ